MGVWVGRDYDNIPDLWGPADGLQFTGMRIRDTYADGINFSNGTRNSRVFNSSFRTTGDDALAMWANPYVKDRTVDNEHDNHFVNNTIQLPWRANGIAIYGGSNNSIENNLVFDTMNYPGIMLATDHSPAAVRRDHADRQQRPVPDRRGVLERGPGVRGDHALPVHPGHHRRHHPGHRHRRLDLRRHPVQERRRHRAGRPDHERADHQLPQRCRHPGDERDPRQRDPVQRHVRRATRPATWSPSRAASSSSRGADLSRTDMGDVWHESVPRAPPCVEVSALVRSSGRGGGPRPARPPRSCRSSCTGPCAAGASAGRCPTASGSRRTRGRRACR